MWKSFLFLILLFSCVGAAGIEYSSAFYRELSSPPLSSRKQGIDVFDDQIQACVKKRDYKKIIGLATDELSKAKNSIEKINILYARAWAYYCSLAFELALEDLSSILSLPDISEKTRCSALILRAGANELAAKAYPESQEDLSVVISNPTATNEQKALCLYQRGCIYGNREGLEQKAMEDYSTVISMENVPADIEVASLNNRGRLFEKVGDSEKALQDYNKAIEIKDVDSWLSYSCLKRRGDLQFRLGRTNQAIDDYNRALVVEKIGFDDKADVLLNRGTVYLLMKDYEKAMQDFDQVLSFGDELDWAQEFKDYANRGKIYLKNKKYKESLDEFNRAIALNDEFDCIDNFSLFGVLLERGLAHAQLSDYSSAIDDFNSIINSKSASPLQHAQARTTRACIYRDQGNTV